MIFWPTLQPAMVRVFTNHGLVSCPHEPWKGNKKLLHFYHHLILYYVVKLYGKCMKEHFSVGISFNVVAGSIQFFDNGLLLFYSGNLIEPFCKIQLIAIGTGSLACGF